MCTLTLIDHKVHTLTCMYSVQYSNTENIHVHEAEIFNAIHLLTFFSKLLKLIFLL